MSSPPGTSLPYSSVPASQKLVKCSHFCYNIPERLSFHWPKPKWRTGIRHNLPPVPRGGFSQFQAINSISNFKKKPSIACKTYISHNPQKATLLELGHYCTSNYRLKMTQVLLVEVSHLRRWSNQVSGSTDTTNVLESRKYSLGRKPPLVGGFFLVGNSKGRCSQRTREEQGALFNRNSGEENGVLGNKQNRQVLWGEWRRTVWLCVPGMACLYASQSLKWTSGSLKFQFSLGIPFHKIQFSQKTGNP